MGEKPTERQSDTVTVFLREQNTPKNTEKNSDTVRIPVTPGIRHAPPSAGEPMPVSYPPAAQSFPQVKPKKTQGLLEAVRYSAPKWKAPVRHSALFYGNVIFIIVLAVVGIVLLLPSLGSHGWTITLGLTFLAGMPVVIVGGFIAWIDNWEREPFSLYIVAFAWGAGVSTLTSYFFNTFIDNFFTAAVSKERATVLTNVLGTPIIEEAFKGIGILVILLTFKKFFNGPVDGIVYGMLIGLGFAFTENVIYFSRYYDHLAEVFRARAILNPFVHPMATAMIGLAVGLAIQQRSRLSIVYFAPTGYLFAVGLHSLYNLSVVTEMSDKTRFLFQLPIYFVSFIVVVSARLVERRDVMSALEEYSKAGWITSNELSMIQSVTNRRHAVTWARDVVAQAGGDADDGEEAMKRFQHELIQLGYSRSRSLRRGTVNRERNRRQEAKTLQLLSELRKVFTGKYARGLA